MRKYIVLILLVLFFVGCQSNARKRKDRLAKEFDDMRSIPSNVLSVERIDNYEIAYQELTDITEDYKYPNRYAIGVLDDSGNNYKYVTVLYDISPFENYEYVRTIMENFETDSTYVDVMLREGDFVKINVYRRVKGGEIYFMWKWMKAKTGTFDFVTVEVMNKSMF